MCLFLYNNVIPLLSLFKYNYDIAKGGVRENTVSRILYIPTLVYTYYDVGHFIYLSIIMSIMSIIYHYYVCFYSIRAILCIKNTPKLPLTFITMCIYMNGLYT